MTGRGGSHYWLLATDFCLLVCPLAFGFPPALKPDESGNYGYLDGAAIKFYCLLATGYRLLSTRLFVIWITLAITPFSPSCLNRENKARFFLPTDRDSE
jgi:hypothetical protein